MARWMKFRICSRAEVEDSTRMPRTEIEISSSGTIVTRTLNVIPEERKNSWSRAALCQRFLA
jgi:uncharacterized protein with GYD domain